MELSLNAAPEQKVGFDCVLGHLFLAAATGGGWSMQVTFGVRVGGDNHCPTRPGLIFSFWLGWGALCQVPHALSGLPLLFPIISLFHSFNVPMSTCNSWARTCVQIHKYTNTQLKRKCKAIIRHICLKAT